MLLKVLYVRFYKSFNYDYLRRHHPSAKPLPWEIVDDKWFPFVRVPIEPRITTIVGANESGKSHLLRAIEKGIDGKNINREDICRYSRYYTVQRNRLKWPEFGFEWADLTDDEVKRVHQALGISINSSRREFLLFRINRNDLCVYLKNGSEYERHEVTSVDELLKIVPKIFRINAEVGLPDSVPLKDLMSDGAGASSPSALLHIDRAQRINLLSFFVDNAEHFKTKAALSGLSQGSLETLGKLLAEPMSAGDEIAERRSAEVRLARDLLYKVAGIDPDAVVELYRAIRDGKEGHANGIVHGINESLRVGLNFPKCWAQDRSFRLLVSCREHDLVFTIRDRTNNDYSFGERSNGLRFFLSYYVQCLANTPPKGKSDIFLMDEPDAYLSSQGQQDLLRVFDDFVSARRDGWHRQMIYVTHSPFLIDKNHSERIRVLEKGADEEGTRVVKNASRNHYEPLRSALGAYAGEGVFIGNCNLVVEGAADQVLLAGAATFLQSRGATDFETIDLNRVTIVPAGSASHVPYVVYLARGRDYEQPAVVVMLDNDEQGDRAKERLVSKPPGGKRLLPEKFVVQVRELAGDGTAFPDLPAKIVEFEDLLPVPLCVLAAKKYLNEYCRATPADVDKMSESAVTEGREAHDSIFSTLDRIAHSINPEFHIDKIGFARAVNDETRRLASHNSDDETVKAYDERMRYVFRRIATLVRTAARELTDERVTRRIDRIRKSFLMDFPESPRKEEAEAMLQDVEQCLDDSIESDQVAYAIRRIRRDFALDQDMTALVPDYERFKSDLDRIRYVAVLESEGVNPLAEGSGNRQTPEDAREFAAAKSAPNPESAL